MIPLCVSGQDLTKSKEFSDESLEIILNENGEAGRSGIKNRHIFILAEEKVFSFKNLEKLFKKYAKTYPEPCILVITIYSNKEMLQRLINFKKYAAIEFTEDEAGKRAAAEYYEKYYPLPKGYFRAEYIRNQNFEFFDYSPKKEDTEMTRISLKSDGK
jgi:hypothetical protein